MDVHTDRLNINGDWKLPEKILPSDWSVENVMIAEGNNSPGKISFSDLVYQKQMIDSAEDRACNYLTFMCSAQCGENTIGLEFDDVFCET